LWDEGAQGEFKGRCEGQGRELEVPQERELELEARERELELEAREQELEVEARELEVEARERERELEGPGNGRERYHPPQSLQQDQVGVGVPGT
jgi:hypothetical protein